MAVIPYIEATRISEVKLKLIRLIVKGSEFQS